MNSIVEYLISYLQKETEEYNDYDKYNLEYNIYKTIVETIEEEFTNLLSTYSIGGQISFDIFLRG